MEIRMSSEEKIKLKSIEEKLKELREFGCACAQDAADNLLIEFFPSVEMKAKPPHKKV